MPKSTSRKPVRAPLLRGILLVVGNLIVRFAYPASRPQNGRSGWLYPPIAGVVVMSSIRATVPPPPPLRRRGPRAIPRRIGLSPGMSKSPPSRAHVPVAAAGFPGLPHVVRDDHRHPRQQGNDRHRSDDRRQPQGAGDHDQSSDPGEDRRGPDSSLRLKPSRSSEPVAVRRRPASSDESLATS